MTTDKIDTQTMRNALSQFATGVTIVCTRDASGTPIGMTASSFNSVSMEPPLILWSVTKTAHSAQTFHDAKKFSVHVLSAEQTDLSNKFARSGQDKFAGVSYTTDENGVPQLDGALVRFDCTTWAVYEGGDHWIIVGHVDALTHETGDGLVFCNGSYATARTIQPPKDNTASDSAKDSPVEDLLIYHLSRAYRQLSDGFHDVVRENGVSVPQWRILASLQGQVSRTLEELSARTFIQEPALIEMAEAMQGKGLCQISTQDGAMVVTGTTLGHERTQTLFTLAREMEEKALADSGDQGQKKLVDLLAEVIQNT